MSTYLQRSTKRQVKAQWRDGGLLLGEFGTRLLVFLQVIIGGGIAFFTLFAKVSEFLDNLLEAFYSILAATFLQLSGDDHPQP
jgi:hypothetical protein